MRQTARVPLGLRGSALRLCRFAFRRGRRCWPGVGRMLRLGLGKRLAGKIRSPSGESGTNRTRRNDCVKPFTQPVQLRIQGEQLRMPLVAEVAFGGMHATLESTFTEGPDPSEIRMVFSGAPVHYVDPARHCPMPLIRSPQHTSRDHESSARRAFETQFLHVAICA
jgi:hypothetical protein